MKPSARNCSQHRSCISIGEDLYEKFVNPVKVVQRLINTDILKNSPRVPSTTWFKLPQVPKAKNVNKNRLNITKIDSIFKNNDLN